jgi:CRISPR-associated protein Cas2
MRPSLAPSDRRAAHRRWHVAYDIADPKRLRRVEKVLAAIGLRVHFSLFVCELDAEQLEALQRRLVKMIDVGVDCVQYTPLCHRDSSRSRHFGASAEPVVAGFWIA